MKTIAIAVILLFSIVAASFEFTAVNRAPAPAELDGPISTNPIDYTVGYGMDEPNQPRTQLQNQAFLYESYAPVMIG